MLNAQFKIKNAIFLYTIEAYIIIFKIKQPQSIDNGDDHDRQQNYFLLIFINKYGCFQTKIIFNGFFNFTNPI